MLTKLWTESEIKNGHAVEPGVMKFKFIAMYAVIHAVYNIINVTAVIDYAHVR